ncbi:MAG: HAMP domain-containing protein [Dehalococcoidia bacterium]|nr:HAMP domain-containing protein [Dehalococcoidia bacterium]
MTSPPIWTLPIRRWLILALISLFVIPVFGLAVAGSIVWQTGRGDDAIGAATMLRDDAALWNDPAWQTAISRDLAESGIDFILFSNGQEIYRSVADPLADTNVSDNRRDGPPWAATNGGRTVRQLVVGGTNPPLTAEIYEPTGSGPSAIWLVPLTGGALLLLTLTGLGWIIGRMLVRPLAATSKAATQVAAGDLDVSLPSSRVREVAEVNSAFESMSVGLRESLEQQATLEQERRFFISAVVHDLRTPLFSLRGYLEGMEKGLADTPEKQQRYIATAQEKATALDRLVNDLFDYSRLEYLGRAPEKERFDLPAIVQRLVTGSQQHAETRGLRLIIHPGKERCEVEADPHLLGRVIENLLDNALRYTPRGGSVEVDCGLDGKTAWFRVADSGPGIPPADLPHLFSPLYRGEASRNRSTGGAGLGLAIAQRIMQAHGGELRAENSTRGAVFTALLPASPPGETL